MKQRITTPHGSSALDLTRKRRLIWLGFSVLFFAIALVTPALELERNQGPLCGHRNWSFGIHLLLVGWLGFLCGQFAWFANLPLAIGWLSLALNRRIAAGICGTSAILLSLHTLQMFRTPLPGVESASDSELLSQLGIGFYLWTLSMLLVVVGAALCGGNATTNRTYSSGGNGDHERM